MARLVFLGTPQVAASVLASLAEAGHDIVLAVTRPDTRRGRGSSTSASPVKSIAGKLGIPVSHSANDAATCGAELGVVVAYGRIIKGTLLASVPMVNLHFSLLPRWRGAAPVERAILAGDVDTGVCLMEVVEELDAGGIYGSRRVTIEGDETAERLTQRLGEVGIEMLLERLVDVPASLGTPAAQVGEVLYAEKIRPSELHLDWTRPAESLERTVRIGRAWTTFRGRRLVVWAARSLRGAPAGGPGYLDGAKVATGEGSLELLEVQPEGKRRMEAEEWLRGVKLLAGEVLGSS